MNCYPNFMEPNGWIALDIDGTITPHKYSVPQPVIDYLRSLAQSGWRIVLATGRPFAFASLALDHFDFPFVLLPQNGSLALDLPGQKLLFKKYMSSSVIPFVENAYEGIDSDFVIYAGYEKGDYCYYRPHRLSQEDLIYLEDLQKRQKEHWHPTQTYDLAKIHNFPLIKCFGLAEKMKIVAERLRATGLFQVSMIHDPFHDSYKLLLVTDKGASKGLSMEEVLRLKGRGSRVIAAGDDENDISLFQVADVKIAMSHAPAFLQEKADLIAPPARDNGIIHALQMVLRNESL